MIDHTDIDRQGQRIACRHSWHYGPDGLPACKGSACQGQTVACGQGLIDCLRPADHAEPMGPSDLEDSAMLMAEDAAAGPGPVVRTVYRRHDTPAGPGRGSIYRIDHYHADGSRRSEYPLGR